MEEDTDERKEDIWKKNILLRNYQIKLLEVAKKENTVLYLPTGAGKTLIAIHVLISRSHEIRRLFSKGGKRAFFLSNTKVLVYQLCEVLQTHTKFRVACLTGDMNVDTWDKAKWISKFEDIHVLVLTAEILKQILQLQFIGPENISVIVFDECHHAVENHPYRLVLEALDKVPASEGPLRLGLTAVLLNSNPKKNQVHTNIQALERAFKGKIITDNSLKEIRSFSAKPVEKIILYEEPSINYELEHIFKIYDNVIDTVGQMNIQSDDSAPEGTSFIDRNKAKRIRKYFVNSKEHFKELGVFGGSISALFYIIVFEKYRLLSKDEREIKALVYGVTELNKIRHVAEKYMGAKEDVTSIFEFSSPKVRKLIGIISETVKQTDVSIIVFVYQRATAVILAFLLKRLSASSENLNFLKPDFIVGTTIFNKETLYLGTDNEEIIRQFSTGSLNLLVATNILEEGVDISSCNTVISFDFPLSYPSYFQGKGRARSSESLYYMLVSENERERKSSLLVTFKNLEKDIFQMVSENSPSRESDEVLQNEIEKINLSRDICIDGLMAIRAVERYCAKLPQDRYSLLSPTAWYTKVGEKKKAFVRLPVNCPLQGVVEGEPRDNKKEAKRSVFLITLKRLYDIGELDNSLSPIPFEFKRCFDNLFPNYKNENVDKSLPQPGTKRRKQMYKMKFAESLSNCLPRPGVKAYLHVIDLKIAFEKPELERKVPIYEALRNPVTFAIISTKKLCKIFQFPLFLDMGQIDCDFLVNYDEIILSETEINDIKSCHFTLFGKVTRSLKNAHIFDNRNKEHSFYVAPVEKNEEGRFVLSWDLIRSDFCRNSKSAVVRYNPSANRDAYGPKLIRNMQPENAMEIDVSSTSLVPFDGISGRLLWAVDQENANPAFTMTEADYRFFVIVPNYRKQDPPQCYIVDKFCHDMSPLSPFPRPEYEDYISYYEDKYMVKITNTRQPLIRARPLFNCSNFNKPRNRKPRRAREKFKEYEEHFIPELCDVIQFDKRFWVKVLLIPTVLNRICHVYCVDEFRKLIVFETGLGVSDLPEGISWKPLEVDASMGTEDEEEINLNSSLSGAGLKSSLPLSKLKDKTQPKTPALLDPERHLYKCGLCDLEFYVKCLTQISFEKLDTVLEENDKVIELFNLRNVRIPKLKLLKRGNDGRGPELATLVQACTSKSANDIVNYERLETLGDSFLKFATTFYLFKNYKDNEGILTNVKGKMVGNKNLLYCALARNIQDVINVTDFVPSSDWNPPLLCVPERLVEGIISNNVDPAVLYRFEIFHEEQFSGVVSERTMEKNEGILRGYEKCCELPTNSLLPYKVLEDKTVSDCVEALIGTYLLALGLPGALQFLSWLGVMPKSKSSYFELMEQPHGVKGPNSADNALMMSILGEVFYTELEDILNYRFKNKLFLLEALSHPSYSKNRITDCYQRLEFLGDAVIDFLITTYVYENCDYVTPGQMTDIRSSLVNNITFACLVVRYELYKYMLSFSPALSKAIRNFVSFQKNRNHIIDDNVLILLEENDCMIAESVQVPKALGDIFESLAGAIFLDSGNSLETVWEVYYRLMKKEIDEFTKTIPKTSVRLLHDICGDRPYYETLNFQGAIKVSCSVYYENREIKAHGFGPNKKEAKRSAAKLVLNKILSLKK